jgi:hypothetical protein
MQAVRSDDCTLTIWTVYRSPRDYPGHWVLRAHDVPGGPRANCFVSKSYHGVARHLPAGVVKLMPTENDDPVIFETWV